MPRRGPRLIPAKNHQRQPRSSTRAGQNPGCPYARPVIVITRGIIAGLLTSSALLAGCTVGPEPRTPTPEALGVPDRFHAVAAAAEPANASVVDWWSTFNDPVLVQVIERALAANMDIDAAGARVRQARAALRATRAADWPTLDATVTAQKQKAVGSDAVAPDRTVYDAGFDASYEADLFGGRRREKQASAADLAATEADLHSTQLTVAAEVALNYVDARLAQRQLEIARANLSRTGRNAADRPLARAGRARRRTRPRAGATPACADRRRRCQRASSSIRRAEPLAVLIGQPRREPCARTSRTPRRFRWPRCRALAVPADVLRRRPDVTSAERTLDRRDRAHRRARGGPLSRVAT